MCKTEGLHFRICGTPNAMLANTKSELLHKVKIAVKTLLLLKQTEKALAQNEQVLDSTILAPNDAEWN